MPTDKPLHVMGHLRGGTLKGSVIQVRIPWAWLAGSDRQIGYRIRDKEDSRNETMSFRNQQAGTPRRTSCRKGTAMSCSDEGY